jgi:hypothetical protein
LRLYSRNAITWNDPRKIANFVTSKDDPVKNFMPAVANDYKNRKASALNPNVIKAMRIWNAIGEYGVKFAANPANPFEMAHDDPNFPVDYTQFPRETLKRKTGQCSDLTSLYAAMLVNKEVRVALLDYPGHVTLMFDTEAEDAAEAGMSRDMLVDYDGSMWVPVEVTYVGKSFSEAVSKAAYAYKAESDKGRVKVIDLEKAFKEYEPVTMPATDMTVVLPDPIVLEKRYDEQVAVLAKDRYQLLKKIYSAQLDKNPDDVDAQIQLGVVELQYGVRESAAATFAKIVEKDPKNSAALNNLGSISFLTGDYRAAQSYYLKAVESEANDADLWLNLAKTAAKQSQLEKTREYGAKAVALSPSYKPYIDVLINGQ